METPLIFPPTSYYMYSEDGKLKVPSFPIITKGNPDELFEKIKASMRKYKWNEEDALLVTFPKNGQYPSTV